MSSSLPAQAGAALQHCRRSTAALQCTAAADRQHGHKKVQNINLVWKQPHALALPADSLPNRTMTEVIRSSPPDHHHPCSVLENISEEETAGGGEYEKVVLF